MAAQIGNRQVQSHVARFTEAVEDVPGRAMAKAVESNSFVPGSHPSSDMMHVHWWCIQTRKITCTNILWFSIACWELISHVNYFILLLCSLADKEVDVKDYLYQHYRTWTPACDKRCRWQVSRQNWKNKWRGNKCGKPHPGSKDII